MTVDGSDVKPNTNVGITQEMYVFLNIQQFEIFYLSVLLVNLFKY